MGRTGSRYLVFVVFKEIKNVIGCPEFGGVGWVDDIYASQPLGPLQRGREGSMLRDGNIIGPLTLGQCT